MQAGGVATRIGERGLSRALNDEIQRVNEDCGRMVGDFFCECSDTCLERIVLCDREYRDVRAYDDRFLLVEGHERLGRDRIVGRRLGWLVVERS